MRDVSGRAVVRLGDPVDHGGEVITALDMKAHGISVTAQDCLVRCPRCGDECRILAGAGRQEHRGRITACEGDLTK